MYYTTSAILSQGKHVLLSLKSNARAFSDKGDAHCSFAALGGLALGVKQCSSFAGEIVFTPKPKLKG